MSSIRLDDDEEEVDFDALAPPPPTPPLPQPLSMIVAPPESSDEEEEEAGENADEDRKMPPQRIVQKKPRRPKRTVEKQPAVFPPLDAARQAYRKAHDAKAAIAAEQHVDGHIYARAARVARCAYDQGIPQAVFFVPFLPAVPADQLQLALARRLPPGYFCSVRVSQKNTYEISVGGWAT